MANTSETAIISGIGHVALYASDMEKTLNFYCGVLGLKHAFTLRGADGLPWIEYLKVSDDNFIELFYIKPNSQTAAVAPATEAATPAPAPAPANNGTFHHICLAVGDIHAAEKALDEAEGPVDVRPKQGSDKNWQMWTHDPDGVKIELMQISPDSPQAKS